MEHHLQMEAATWRWRRRRRRRTLSQLQLLWLASLTLAAAVAAETAGVHAQLINRAPHFVPQVGDMSHFSLSEGTPVGTPVYQLKGVDPENAMLHYSISGQQFTVESGTGVVTLARPLDRERAAHLELIISVTDEGIGDREPNTVSLRRVVAVSDDNDNPPVFHNRPYSANVSEAANIGDILPVWPRVLVTDADVGANAELTLRCRARADLGDDAQACDTFHISAHKTAEGEYEAQVRVRARLDYETRAAYVLVLEARDSSERPLSAHAALAVSVLDVQDRPPRFLHAPYSAAVPENLPPDTSVMEISAQDGDSGSPRPVLLTLENEHLGCFRLESERGSGRGVLRTTLVPLDRESPTVADAGGVYTFSVKTYDMRPTLATLDGKVKRGKTTFGASRAGLDPCCQVPGEFEKDWRDATELINNEIPADYSVTQVTIVVTDEDDHEPEFNKAEFNVSIPENIEAGSLVPGLSVHVQDKDVGANAKYDLRLRDVANSAGVFALSTDRGEGRTSISIRVNDSSQLDYDVDERRTFSFDIVASVKDHEASHARVNVELLDTNDNAPIFDKAAYKYHVEENATHGTKVGEAFATDNDSGVLGEIEYSLNGFGISTFATDQATGGLYVRGPLDYENQKSYSLTLVARDGGGRTTATSVFVEVTDVNDNAPEFEQTEYTRTIRDGTVAFEPQLFVRANDRDGEMQGGGQVKYSLQYDNSIAHRGHVFAVDESSGEIRMLRPASSMDTARGQYELIVRATDAGRPPLYNETKIFIRVGVLGNQRPTFKGNYKYYKRPPLFGFGVEDDISEKSPDMTPSNYVASIREDAAPGQNVTMVSATDPDGLDSLLTYHFVSGARDNFIVHEKSGLITVASDAVLDRDASPERYEVVVAAVDGGSPLPETATATVFITVRDVNDKPPRFNLSYAERDTATYVSERAEPGSIVSTIAAYDTDSNSKLKYAIVEPIRAFSKSGVQLKDNSQYDYKSAFYIDTNTGDLILNGSLDYSSASIIILTVKVVDENAEVNVDEQSSTVEHTVYVQPYADRKPQFRNSGWSSSSPTLVQRVREELAVGSTLMELVAIDPISGRRVTDFKVVDSQPELVHVEPQSGRIVLTDRLDYEDLSSPNLTLTVKATGDDKTEYSLAKIVIQVININDNAPIFESEYAVSVPESARNPERVVKVKATDADAALTARDNDEGYSRLRYSLKGENSELFVIQPETGLIQIAPNKSLDRERQSVLRLEVEATDSPRGAPRLSATTLVHVDVLDVNDNAPSFELPIYTAVVAENAPIGIGVLNMTARDPDEGLGGEITYELLDEGDVNGLFALEKSTGELRSRAALTGRGRTAPYRLRALATDGGGLAGETALTLYIGDVSANDGVPRFIRPALDEVAFVFENEPIGTVVFQAVASDPDDPTQPSGQLLYTLQQDDRAVHVFTVDERTGVVRTRASLDRERVSSYQLVLTVSDRGAPPQRTSRLLRVQVADIDDHKPHFQRHQDAAPLDLRVAEEVAPGTAVGELRALDEDIGDNAAIDYAIISGNEAGLFRLERGADNVATLRTSTGAHLDRESTEPTSAAPEHLLTIKCFKLGAALPAAAAAYNRLEPSEMQVRVWVQDVDDHAPRWAKDNATANATVRLTAPADTLVATLRAHDPDPDSLPLQYSLLEVEFMPARPDAGSDSARRGRPDDVFALHATSGELRTLRTLLHFADGTFALQVRANNSDTQQHDDLHMKVSVVRERQLLQFVWRIGGGYRGDGGGGGGESAARARLERFRGAAAQALTALGLTLSLQDAAPLRAPDRSIDFSSIGSCFQLRRGETALEPREMRTALMQADAELRAVYAAHGVSEVRGCAVPAVEDARARRVQHALLALAVLLVLAALLSSLILCCMHRRYRRAASRCLLAREAVAVPASYVTAPVPLRMYAEPGYAMAPSSLSSPSPDRHIYS